MADNNEVNDQNVVTLEPFLHQVGGRSTILVLGQSICKPIDSREHTFYETIPLKLKPFVPEFKGLIELDFNESSDGYLTITAKPTTVYKTDNNYLLNTECKIKLYKSTEDMTESRKSSLTRIDCYQDMTLYDSQLDNNDNNVTQIHNPWALKTISSLRERYNYKQKKFLLLENLTFKFEKPCILDIKMGTRQHDNAADDAKVRLHTLKVAETTSGSLGLRIIGIQVYNKSSERFIYHNKYFGRTLTPDTLNDTLKMFLQIENKSKMNLIGLLIKRLEELLSIVNTLETFRFYTSSLLILYEGNTDQFNSNSLDVRMIDFAHTEYSSTMNKGPDRGYIFGLKNLIKLLKNIESENVI